ncbi:MAG: glycosyltransferase family 4 protein [archaeon]
MKIVLISWGYLEYVLQLANALSNEEEVTLFLPDNFREFAEKNKLKNLNLEFFEKVRIRNPKNFFIHKKIVDKIKSINPDVIHIQDGDIWFSLMLPFLKKFPLIITLHDPKQHIGEEKLRETIRDKINQTFASGYIVHGEYLKELLSSHLKVSKDKIFIAKHGNFNILAKPRKKTLKQKRILFFGRIWPYKGLDILIKCEPILKKSLKDYKIVIAGKGEDFEKYQSLIQNPDNFEIHNRFIDNNELDYFFNESDIVVLPYVEATQSGVICLAYSFGKPVIATKVGSLPELIDDEKTGILVEPNNEVKLAESIVSLFNNRRKLNKMGNYALNKANIELDWNIIAKKTIDIYKNVHQN